MKRIVYLLLAALALSFGTPYMADAQKKSKKPKTVSVKGYTKKNGQYVKPYKRSKPSKRK